MGKKIPKGKIYSFWLQKNLHEKVRALSEYNNRSISKTLAMLISDGYLLHEAKILERIEVSKESV